MEKSLKFNTFLMCKYDNIPISSFMGQRGGQYADLGICEIRGK